MKNNSISEEITGRTKAIIALLTASFVMSDQLSKYVMEQALSVGRVIDLGFMKFELSQNYGIAFGIALPQVAIVLLAMALLFVVFRIFTSEFNMNDVVTHLSFSMIVGGAIGNLIDRFTRGYVVDFISVWKWPNFNFADISVVLGVVIVIILQKKEKDKYETNLKIEK